MMQVDRNKARRRPVAASVAHSTASASSMFGRGSAGRDGGTVLSLIGKDFVLDIENVRLANQLSVEIEKLGGRIVTEISEEKKPFCLVSDSVHMEKIEKLKADQITPQILKCLPMLVRDAVRLRVRYRSPKAFLESLAKLKTSIRTQKKVMTAPVKKPAPSTTSTKKDGMITLHEPYLKMEDARGAFAPLYKQFTSQSDCHRVYLGKFMGKSLFHKNHHPDAPRTEKSPCDKARATMPKSGYCEICCKKFDNSKEHFASREHTMNVSQPGLWTSVDKLCGSFLDYVSSSNPRTRRHRPSPPSPSDYRHF